MKPTRKAIKSPDKSSWDKFTTPKPKSVDCPDFAFCLWCGYWFSEEHLATTMLKTKKCPQCRWMLFRLNTPGARQDWEEERAKQPKYEE